MAHCAVLNRHNVVENVVVISDEDCLDEDGNESETVGIAFCKSLWGEPSGQYIQTSYNSNIRKQYAEIGGTYDSNADQFITSKPYNSWILNGDNDWVARVALPADSSSINYVWDESVYQEHNSKGWVVDGITPEPE